MRVLVYDLETGGLDPKSCGITEIGAVIGNVITGQVIDRFQLFVWPETGLEYTPTALQVQGQTLDSLREKGKPIRYVFKQLTSFIFDHIGAPIKSTAYAWNANFDKSFMMEHTARLGEKYCPVPYHTICAMEAFKHGQKFHGLPPTPNSKLRTACAALGVDFNEQDAHAADYDAEKTFLALSRMIAIQNGEAA